MDLSNTFTSLIRTYVPALVGLLIGWAVSKGVAVDPATQAGVTAAVSAGAIIVYYAAARWLERKFPAFGWFLGVPKQPVYTEPPGTPPIER